MSRLRIQYEYVAVINVCNEQEREVSMNPYELKQVIKMWEQETLTAEQAIGQILLHLQSIGQRLGQLEQRIEQRGIVSRLKGNDQP